MKKILVSGASGIVGYGILRSLKRAGGQFTLIGTSIYSDSAAQGFCDIFEPAPPTGDAAYLGWLIATIRKHSVDLVIPGIELDMFEWAEHAPEIQAAGAAALLNDLALIRLCKDKWAFYNDLRAAGLPCAIETTLDNEFSALKARFGLPFLLKPRQGFGSKGLVIVDSEETFLAHQKQIGPTLMAQPIVGSEEDEFTTAVFGDGQGGCCANMTLKRKLSKDGFTEKAEVAATGEFAPAIKALCARFRPVGPTNFQFRKGPEGIKLLEINPRISSSTSIRTAFGYNESAMAADFLLDHRLPVQPEIRRGRAARYTDERIFYEDSVHL